MGASRALYRFATVAGPRWPALTLLLMLVGAAAEMATVGAVVPFLALAANPATTLIGPDLRRVLAFADGNPLTGAAILLALSAIAGAGMRIALAWTSQKFIMKIGHEIASAIFSNMLRQPYPTFLMGNSSEFLSAIEKVQHLVYGLLQPLMQGAISIVLALFVAILLFSINPLAAGAGAIFLGAAYFITHLIVHRRVQRHGKALGSTITARTKIVQEAYGGIRDIILEQSQAQFERVFRSLDLRERQTHATSTFMATSPRFVIEAVGLAVIAAITLATSTRPGGVIASLPLLGALALGAQRMLPLVQQAWQGWARASSNLPLLLEVAGLIEATSQPQGTAARTACDFKGLIELDDVSFRYNSGPFALHQVSLRIEPGERIGVSGSTGSGKSSLLDLIMGLLEPSSGEIRFDGTVLDPETRRVWWSAIAHVPQHVFLTDDTLASNIAFAVPGEIDPVRVREAATAAQLDEFVRHLPQGLDTVIGERGVRLSGGQRQRLGIARALYKRTPILILDEATSALDERTEAAVLENITAQRGRTIILVSHRASTIAACDRVVHVVDGRVLSSGPFPQ